jgi:DnaJ like chaperone protein
MGRSFSLNKLFGSVSKLMQEEEVQEKKLSPQQQSHQLEIENSILVLAAAVIRCDNNFSSDTEKHITDYLSRQFGGSNKNKRLQSVQSHVEIGTEPFTKIACKELKLLTTYDSRINILHFLFGVAASDDFINAKEVRCLQRISGYLGVSVKDFVVVKDDYTSQHNPYVLLGLEEGVSFEKVKSAYRKMILKYHPDKRGGKVTEEEANRKFREIQKAFDVISRQMKEE